MQPSLRSSRPSLRAASASLVAALAFLGTNCPGALGLLVGFCKRDITPISPSLTD